MPIYIEKFILSDAVINEDKGKWQFTLGTDLRKNLDASASLQTKYGLTDKIQLDFEIPCCVTARSGAEVPAGWSSANLGLRYQFLRNSSTAAVSAGLLVDFSVNARGELDYEPVVLAAKMFGRLQLHASFSGEIEGPSRNLFFNAGAVHPFQRR
jgi:hypothetical protein